MFGTALGLLHDGVDDNAVPHDTQKADDAKDDREDGTAMKGPIYSWRQEEELAAVEDKAEIFSNVILYYTLYLIMLYDMNCIYIVSVYTVCNAVIMSQ